MKLIKFIIYRLVLYPLILRNYSRRKKSAITGDGIYPDEWYWADSLGCDWGCLPYTWRELFKKKTDHHKVRLKSLWYKARLKYLF